MKKLQKKKIDVKKPTSLKTKPKSTNIKSSTKKIKKVSKK